MKCHRLQAFFQDFMGEAPCNPRRSAPRHHDWDSAFNYNLTVTFLFLDKSLAGGNVDASFKPCPLQNSSNAFISQTLHTEREP